MKIRKTNHLSKLPFLLEFPFENSEQCPFEYTDCVDLTNSYGYFTQGGNITYSK